jgi:predicted lactoylglutathione lyase
MAPAKNGGMPRLATRPFSGALFMPKQVFVNLPIRDLAKAKAFYEAIGAVNNPQFSDDTSACMVISDTIYVMLLTHPKWAHFTKKPISDAHAASEVMLALSADDCQAVDTMVSAAGANGGKADVNATQDLGFMYGRSFEDRDGHIRETFFMDMSQMPQGRGQPDEPVRRRRVHSPGPKLASSVPIRRSRAPAGRACPPPCATGRRPSAGRPS